MNNIETILNTHGIATNWYDGDLIATVVTVNGNVDYMITCWSLDRIFNVLMGY